MSLARIGKLAPQFIGRAYHKGQFKQIESSNYKGKYICLFFYPHDFTFVCPTEIIAFNEAYSQFTKKNCALLGCSTDSVFVHKKWCNTERKDGGLGKIEFPLLADLSQKISKDYGVLIDDGNSAGAAFRGTFIIDANGILKNMQIGDLGVGRNPDEVLRLVEGYQYNEKHGEVCPVSWIPGSKSFSPDESDPRFIEFLTDKK